MPVQSFEDADQAEYAEFGERDSSPMCNFDECTFYPLTPNDRGYFNMMLSPPMWNLVVALQTWISDNPDGSNVLREAARRDRMKAWALTGLAQPAGAARLCCFLRMSIAHEDNLDCVQHLFAGL